ncbi:Tetratricopeptide repeat (TPR)-like superfamily protein [Striga hermonthica]|uniref:Tetratricopeptide repeat (TPR)-like superfamily protein n=1 Tax=Striga hermonthica TaxID=68872 RepID=A0A9N7R825_STRHE|nr:Tetratricopeptide repeat (TPR)-like superfamily protein [Striga hermonthica]
MAAARNITVANRNQTCPITTSSSQLSALIGNPRPNTFQFSGTTFPRIHRRCSSIPSLSRRLIVVSAVSELWNALTGADPARESLLSIRRGMLLFRQGDVQGSLVEFDRAIELDQRQRAYLWQRGLSLYYLDRFEEGAEQFRLDVAQNPNDTEESIWCFLCEARLYGVDEARKQFLEVGTDPRPVMREAYRLFRDGGDPEKLVSAFSCGRQNEYFYASLYAGLYYESQNKHDEAKLHLMAACKCPYGSRSDDYMASLAKVHCDCRNWRFG